MKKFAFRLDSALRWRNTQLKLERAKLQSLFGEQQRLNRDIDALKQERSAAVVEVQQSRELHASELRTLASYLVGAEFRADRLKEQLAKRNDLVEKQRAQVLDAELQVRLLEKLRDKRKGEWQVEFDKELENNAAEAWLASHF